MDKTMWILIIAAVLAFFTVFLWALLRANGPSDEDDEEQWQWLQTEARKRENDRRRKS